MKICATDRLYFNLLLELLVNYNICLVELCGTQYPCAFVCLLYSSNHEHLLRHYGVRMSENLKTKMVGIGLNRNVMNFCFCKQHSGILGLPMVQKKLKQICSPSCGSILEEVDTYCIMRG